MFDFDPLLIFNHFYPQDTPLKRLLLKHSIQVRDKAIQIIELNPDLNEHRKTIEIGSLLHDIGVAQCHAPAVLCNGDKHYLQHGIIGAAMLRNYALEHDLDLEPFARICERHMGAGISKDEIIAQGLPLPHQDFLPISIPEIIVCIADKFFSKSGEMKEKSFHETRNSLVRFGSGPLARFDEMCSTLNLNDKLG
ncbi:MAG: HDIG domain-containing protein [Lentisphaerae bacterium]|jgi:uncharacterized protein|nr:HDIG domain-containing protein [Lentisphaerota bacterium]